MLEDKQIISLYQSGQIDIMDVLIEKYKNPLYKFCYHLTVNRQEADDLFQDTWVKAVQNIDSFDTAKSFKTWLFAIAMNKYRDNYRKAKRWLNRIKVFFADDAKQSELDRIEASNNLVEESIENNEIKQHLQQCINSLDDDFRIPLILFYFKDMSYDQISEIAGIPVGTVKSRLSSAKTKLRKAMEVGGFEGYRT